MFYCVFSQNIQADVQTIDPLAPDCTISCRLLCGKRLCRPSGIHTLYKRKKHINLTAKCKKSTFKFLAFNTITTRLIRFLCTPSVTDSLCTMLCCSHLAMSFCTVSVAPFICRSRSFISPSSWPKWASCMALSSVSLSPGSDSPSAWHATWGPQLVLWRMVRRRRWLACTSYCTCAFKY